MGDGNCLFRALSLQLTGTQDHHLEIRKVIAEFEKTNEIFEQLHKTINQTPFSSHLQNIKKTCVWGTTVEILATSSMFHVDVYVATDSYHPGRPTWLKYTPRATPVLLDTALKSKFDAHLNSGFHRGWVEIAHLSKSHFDAIKPLSGTTLVRPTINETMDTVEI